MRYGRLHAFPRTDFGRRVAGRLTHWETTARVFRAGLAASLPRVRTPNPTLHLDPLSVLRHRLEPRDIVLCHDVGPITHADHFAPGVDRLYGRAYDTIRSAKPHMVFVSQTSRRAFHALYGEDFPSSLAIHIPIRREMNERDEIQPAGVRAPFLLTVGSIGRRKNQARCIEAFARSGLAEQGWQYVLIGGREPGAEEAIALGMTTAGVIMPGYADEAELRWLYRHAGGFVLMSLLEGFGMPVIEAAKHDLPCLVTESSVLAEVGGPAMLRADALDSAAIADGMRALAQMPDAERAERQARSRQHIELFDRDLILGQWRQLIDRLAGGPS
ncbi:glycosyltransferase involved in cell wall biosynthesis [Ancylobacter aquaticus]|uniref:Glycosyltransferase involved in cell wall biosynthesis n=1 Tax=Ancylobacter aquaticus TaxID=100 RepID=A0A4R1I5P5_ANCAQ|nr:glycosyltransferase involved in cell wall biosynthesis [Ancylobacter aquaticus]